MSKIVDLNLKRTLTTDAGPVHLEGLRKLEYLSITQCTKLTDAGLASLGKLTHLTGLALFECIGISNDGRVHLDNLRKLKMLRRIYNAVISHQCQSLFKTSFTCSTNADPSTVV